MFSFQKQIIYLPIGPPQAAIATKGLIIVPSVSRNCAE